MFMFGCYAVFESLRIRTNPSGSSVHGILQARILKWVAIPPPGDRGDPATETKSFASPALAGGFFLPPVPPGRTRNNFKLTFKKK